MTIPICCAMRKEGITEGVILVELLVKGTTATMMGNLYCQGICPRDLTQLGFGKITCEQY